MTGTSFLCISTYFKGNEFLRSCKAQGNTVYLLTDQKLEHKPWVREALDEIFYITAIDNSLPSLELLIKKVTDLMLSRKIDRIVALDDFDVEKAALLREHFRIPGMGQTTARHFRDKLAMRVQARDAGLRCPMFSALFNDIELTYFSDTVTYPCVIKPRGEASTTGIKKVWSREELWQSVHSLGENRHNFLVEQFKPGDVYHVDSLTVEGKTIFTQVSQYLSTPMEVAHGGGVFRSVTCTLAEADHTALVAFNEQILKAFGLRYSASHTEFIKCHEDGQFYFLETASRVGGAHLAEMVEASSGINLWREWAKIETSAATGQKYKLPKVERVYSGIVISLSRQQWPDMSPFQDPEIWWRMNEEYHVGLIVRSESQERVLELLEQYTHLISEHYHASAPVPDKPTH